MFFYLLFFLVHYLLDFSSWVLFSLQHLKELVTQENGEEEIKKIVSKLTKIPSHVGISIESEFLPRELSKIICWSLCAGISEITIFDPKLRNLELEVKNLEQCFEKQKQKFFGSFCSDSHHVQITTPVIQQFNCHLTNDYCVKASIKNPFHVTLISHEHGRWDLVKFAKSFCVEIKNNQYKLSHLTEDLMEENLYIGDPDLIIQFGDLKTLGGFLPWHIRLAEIFQVHTLRNIHSSTFVSALQHYSNVIQRCGA